MKIINYPLFITILLSFSIECTENMDMLYSTSFLKNYSAVNSYLKEQGFKEITFKTPDNLTLYGLFLERPNATCNVIVCAGWFPGKKEGMATFFDLLPDYCNILLFDARGRGQSEGSLLWKLWKYGIHEYKDIYGTISWIHKHNKLPIIIGGTCSGIFNAAHAIIKLNKNNTLAQSRVKGIFFDSGWGSVMTMSQSSAIANIQKYIAKTITLFYGTKENIDQRILYKLSYSLIYRCFTMAHFIFARPLIMQYEKNTNLFDKIHQIPLPIFFIHSYDDTHADINNTIKLSHLALNKQCWWIEKSSHAKHHLIHKKLYKEKLKTFIDEILP